MDARSACQAENGDLASINSPYEQAFIESLIGAESIPFWVGMTEVINPKVNIE